MRGVGRERSTLGKDLELQQCPTISTIGKGYEIKKLSINPDNFNFSHLRPRRARGLFEDIFQRVSVI